MLSLWSVIGFSGWRRNRRKAVNTYAIGLFVVVAWVGQSPAGTVLLEDDFSSAQLDSSKWSVLTTGIPSPGGGAPAVVVAGGKVLLKNRGYLNTTQQFKPTDPVIGGLEITGTFQNLDPYNYFQALTRSDGVPSGPYGETRNGIEFHVDEFGKVEVLRRLNSASTSLAISAITLSNVTSAQFNFRITDDGSSVSFFVGQVGNPSNSLSLSGFENTVFTTNLITFHGRESEIGTQSGYLDDVRITSLTIVPEPTTFGLMFAGAAAFGAFWWRRREQVRT